MPRRVIARIRNDHRFESLEETTTAQKESFAEALRTRRPPAIAGTDSINFRGKYNADPFKDCVGPIKDLYRQQAAAMGISLSGKVYNPLLVRPEYQGRFDPEALIGSTGDVRHVLDKHPEWDAEGMVNQTGREPENPPNEEPWGVDDRLVEEEVVEELQAQGVGEVGVKEFAELKEKKHSQLKGDMA